MHALLPFLHPVTLFAMWCLQTPLASCELDGKSISPGLTDYAAFGSVVLFSPRINCYVHEIEGVENDVSTFV